MPHSRLNPVTPDMLADRDGASRARIKGGENSSWLRFTVTGVVLACERKQQWGVTPVRMNEGQNPWCVAGCGLPAFRAWLDMPHSCSASWLGPVAAVSAAFAPPFPLAVCRMSATVEPFGMPLHLPFSRWFWIARAMRQRKTSYRTSGISSAFS